MAAKVLIDPFLSINGTNLTVYTRKVTLPLEREDLDSTTAGSGGAKEHAKGLESGELEVEFLDSFGVGEVDAVLYAAFKADAAVAFEVRADSDAVAVTNPKWTGFLQVTEYGIGGDVGQLAMKSQKFPTTGPTVRATA